MDDSEKVSLKRQLVGIGRILPYYIEKKWYFILAGLIVVVSAILESAMPLVFREIIDRVIPTHNGELLLFWAGLYFVLLLGKLVIEYAVSLILGFLGVDIVSDLKVRIFRHVMTLSMRFFEEHKVGSLISRIESDTQKLFMLFSNVGLQMLGAMLNILISIVVMLNVNPRLTVIVLLFFPLYLGGVMLFFKKMRPLFQYDRELNARIAGFLGENLKNTALLRNLNATQWSAQAFAQINQERWRFGAMLMIKEQSVWFLLMLLPQLVIVAILYKSVGWIGAGTVTIGTVWMFIQYINAAMAPLRMISEQIGEIQRSLSSADRIFEILDGRPEISENAHGPQFKFQNQIEFRQVSFAYQKEDWVINDLSFALKRGEKIAVVGGSGSGKSTIMKLMARFYDPQRGAILVDGVDLRTVNRHSYYQKLALILQEIYLFPGTIRDNLTVLRSDISDRRIYEALESLELFEWIKKFHKGLDTPLAEGGQNLSFGERQLLSFVRAMIFQSELVIMDEATSSIDPYTEMQLQRCLHKLLVNRSAMIIAHRLSTIADADRILVMENGHLREMGTQDELLARGGIYAQLYTGQMLAQESGL